MKRERTKGRWRIYSVKVLPWILVSVAAVFIAGCTVVDPDDDDESGVIGTGFRGTVSEQKQIASRQVQIRAQTGERSLAAIGADGQYVADADTVSGIGPWVMRSDLGNDSFRYGIAYKPDTPNDLSIANVHGYTDIVLRSWFLQEHNLVDLDSAFNAEQPMPAFPTDEQFTREAARYFALVNLVLADYALIGSQLLNEEFRNDNQGIDRFLDLNPVVVDGRQVTFVKTDPGSNTQTSISVDLLLGADAQQPDTQLPSLPGNLRAFGGGAPGEIVLVWDPATDNTAVVGYEIVRDGEFVAISPYPVYTDEGLMPNTSYTYQITAVDLAGNRSAAAMVTTDGTLTEVDVTPPPMPQSLVSVLASTQRVELTWLQDDISNVAGFNVYRGLTSNAAELSLLVQVTSTSVTDATISAGLEYCYQVASVNASGRESVLSEILCIRATGIVLAEPDDTSIVVQPLAGLRVPDTEAMSCTRDFPGYAVNSDITVPAGCYRVEQDIIVDNFGVLNLQPGVVLKFAANTQLLVSARGALVSAGTSDNPVVMTGERPVSGWWLGVVFDDSNNAQNLIRHSVVEYTGSEPNTAGISLKSSTNVPARLRVENSLIRFGDWYGISIPGADSRLTSFRGNLITQNRRAALLNYTALPSITDGSFFIDNTLNLLFVSRGTYVSDFVINDPGLPLQIDGINQIRNTIVINEGVRLNFTDANALIIRDKIAIRGTAENPVVLSSSSPGPGNWQGLQLVEDAIAEISNVIIENAGQSSAANPEGANLFANNARLSLENVTLRFSSSFGFHSTGDQVIVDKAERITIVNNARDDVVDPNAL